MLSIAKQLRSAGINIRNLTRGFAIPVLLLLILIIGCSGQSGNNPFAPWSEGETRELSIRLDIIEFTDDHFAVTVNLTGVTDVAAISLRLAYNTDALEPIDVEWSDSINNSGSTFHLLGENDFIPLAFVSADRPIGLTLEGEFCRIHFRRTGAGEYGCTIIEDAEFLIALNSERVRLNVTTGGGV